MIGNSPEQADKFLRELASADVLKRLAKAEDALGMAADNTQRIEKLEALLKTTATAPEGKK